MATYYKVAGSSEPSSYTFGLTNGPKWAIGISRIVGADPNNPIDAVNSANGTKSATPTAPSINTTMCNDLVLTFFTNKKDSYWDHPAGTDEIYDQPNTQNGLIANMLAAYVQSDKGATGSKSARPSISDVWVAQQIAIRPALGRSGANARGNTIAATTSDLKETAPIEEQTAAVVIGYPNPVRDFLNITIEGITEQPNPSNVMIVDRIGRSYPVKATWEQRNNALQVDLSDLNKGLYLIKVSVSTGTQVLKIYKE
jgi:hypothetical protein